MDFNVMFFKLNKLKVLLRILFIMVINVMNVSSIVLMFKVICRFVDVFFVVVLMILVVFLFLFILKLFFMVCGFFVLGIINLLKIRFVGVVIKLVVSRYLIGMLRSVYLNKVEFVIVDRLFVIIVNNLECVSLVIRGLIINGDFDCFIKILVVVVRDFVWFVLRSFDNLLLMIWKMSCIIFK